VRVSAGDGTLVSITVPGDDRRRSEEAVSDPPQPKKAATAHKRASAAAWAARRFVPEEHMCRLTVAGRRAPFESFGVEDGRFIYRRLVKF
jgi:hypothetical protein